MKRHRQKYKQGAASFFIVAISTMILMITATSFATVVISEVTRSSNDDLSQSAYDSAMAGVEDAKLAFANYRKCLESGVEKGKQPSGTGGIPTCENIIWWMEHPDCDMVAHILGREQNEEDGSVQVSDISGNTKSDFNQAYTCVELNDALNDYRASLDSTNTERIVNVSLDGVAASRIKKVRLKWYSQRGGENFSYTNFDGSRVTFKPLSSGGASTPPTLQVGLIQTAGTFSLSQFDNNSGNDTNRATMYFVPTNNSTSAKGSGYMYKGIYNGTANVLSARDVALTNDHNTNLPFLVYCNGNDDYACVVDIMLPNPVGGPRNDSTFKFVVTVPYGQPETDFSMEFYCADNDVCSKQKVMDASGAISEQNSSQANLKGMGVNVDSTGRANDLYRRIEVRLEATDTSFRLPLYGIQLLNTNTNEGSNLDKKLTVPVEWN